MIVTSKWNVDLLHPGNPPIVEAVQDDRYSRNLELSLFTGDDAWPVPKEADVRIRYRKPDGKEGEYNVLPDGNMAWCAEENVLTVALAPQVLVVPGDVILTIILTLEQKQISTGRIVIRVKRGLTPSSTDSEDYYNVAAETIIGALGFTPANKDAISIGLHTDGLLYLFIDGHPVGTGIALKTGAANATAVLGSAVLDSAVLA